MTENIGVDKYELIPSEIIERAVLCLAKKFDGATDGNVGSFLAKDVKLITRAADKLSNGKRLSEKELKMIYFQLSIHNEIDWKEEGIVLPSIDELLESFKPEAIARQQLLELENYRPKAMEILQKGDPVKYILDVFGRIHVGDRDICVILLLSIACQSVSNSAGIQPKLSGPSGKGKTHAAMAMLHLVPMAYRMTVSLSAKALFYYEGLKPGMIIFSDDVRLSDELEDTLKRAMTNFQQPTTHMAVNKDRTGTQQLVIPPRICFWMTSVSDNCSDELCNRLFGLGVDDSSEQDDAVTRRLLQSAKYGQMPLPEDEEVMICRAIIHIMKEKLVSVKIPFATEIRWSASGDRRNLGRFLDLVRSFAVMRQYQRREVGEGEIEATEEDFYSAKVLYESQKESQVTKLTNSELRLVEWIVGKGWLTINDIVRQFKKSDGSSYTYEYVRKMINGNGNGRGGLIDRVPGMEVDRAGKEQKFRISEFRPVTSEIVSLGPTTDEV